MELLEKQLPWQPVVVAPLGDIQAGSAGTDWDHLRRHIDKALSLDAYFIGTGDYSDFLSPSNRRALLTAGLYDTAMDLIEKWCGQHVEDLMQVLEPTRGRWLSLVQGHHFYNFGANDTTDTRLAKFLGTTFAGDSSVTTLTFRSDQLQKSAECRIFCAHGTGKGYGFLERIAPGFPNVDLFLMGHNCELGYRAVGGIRVIGSGKKMRMVDSRQMFALSGSFFKGYAAGSTLGEFGRPAGSYVEKAGMRPLPIGGQFFKLTPVMKTDYTAVEVEPTS